jgi:hypothetical protein
MSKRNYAPLALQELTTALHNTNRGKSLGLDGLTYDFYKEFWDLLGPLLLKVATTSLQDGQLPSSMRNGVITLIPKKGDFTVLSNWRPITLLNTDYKLITRCLSSRISSVLSSLITIDQSYCAPGRTIYTHLHLIRDVIEYANQKDVPLAVISLDQASAYDSVEHPYIYHVISKYGFGPNVIRHVKTVYRNAQGLVKVQHTLTAPFPYERGV